VSSDKKSPDDKTEAEREAIAERVLQTARELEQLLKDANVLSKDFDPNAFDPVVKLYEEYDARLQAEATILDKLCEIALPEIKLVAKPVRTPGADAEPAEGKAELEAICGSLPARHRQSEWLDVPGMHLDGATDFLGAFTDARDGDSGVLTSKEFYLLVDGRLVEVHTLGTWRVINGELRDTLRTIISTRVVTSKDVVLAASLTDLIMKLRQSLHLALTALEGKHVPDLEARRARFDGYVIQYWEHVQAHVEGLRRLADTSV
jgi:hypothetical protein